MTELLYEFIEIEDEQSGTTKTFEDQESEDQNHMTGVESCVVNPEPSPNLIERVVRFLKGRF